MRSPDHRYAYDRHVSPRPEPGTSIQKPSLCEEVAAHSCRSGRLRVDMTPHSIDAGQSDTMTTALQCQHHNQEAYSGAVLKPDSRPFVWPRLFKHKSHTTVRSCHHRRKTVSRRSRRRHLATASRQSWCRCLSDASRRSRCHPCATAVSKLDIM